MEEGNRIFPSDKATDKKEIESVDVAAAEVKDTSINMEDQPYSKADDHKEVKGTVISDDQNTKETATQVVENQVSGMSSFFLLLDLAFNSMERTGTVEDTHFLKYYLNLNCLGGNYANISFCFNVPAFNKEHLFLRLQNSL